MDQDTAAPSLVAFPWLLRALRKAFGDFDENFVTLMDSQIEWKTLEGGRSLFAQGDPGDTLYFLVGGRLRVTVSDGSGQSRVLGDIRRGETLGEMALLTGEPRSASVVAVRDSTLVGLSRHAYEQVLRRYPLVSMHVARFIIERLNRSADPRRAWVRPATVALVPITEGAEPASLAAELLPGLARYGTTCRLDAEDAAKAIGHSVLARRRDGAGGDWQEVSHWIDQMETEHDLVLLIADATASPWTEHCLRHADMVLLVADAEETETAAAISALASTIGGAQRLLLLQHPADSGSPRHTRRWIDAVAVDGHLHRRRGHRADLERIARVLTGNAVGLVFGGGGARGFAHLGVLRALEEAHIPVDYVGGTSIGAVMAAYAAFDRPSQAVIDLARQAFRRNPTSDVNLTPMISLIGGRQLKHVIDSAVHELAGFDADIEDTWKPLYCIATNFTRASEAVLRRGPLAKSVRASVSIPAALPPVVLGGDLMIDGGTFNNFPTDIMARQGAGFIFGCDLMRDSTRPVDVEELPSSWELLRDRLRPRRHRRHRLPSLASIILNVSILHSQSRMQQSRRLADVCFTPNLGKIGMLDWKAFDAAVDAGYRHAREVIAAIPADQLQRLRETP